MRRLRERIEALLNPEDYAGEERDRQGEVVAEPHLEKHGEEGGRAP